MDKIQLGNCAQQSIRKKILNMIIWLISAFKQLINNIKNNVTYL